MREFLEILIFATMGVFLLWFGYTLFFGIGLAGSSAGRSSGSWGWAFRRNRSPKPSSERSPGDPQTCPVCSAKLDNTDLVSSLAFPSLNGGKDRFMHIKGCMYCLVGDRQRVCPVCLVYLQGDDILISRLFERLGRKPHVHVLGCTSCRGRGRSRY